MTGTHPPARHRIYLLSVWRENQKGETGQPQLRFSLKDPHSGENYGFSDLEKLMDFLEKIFSDSEEKN